MIYSFIGQPRLFLENLPKVKTTFYLAGILALTVPSGSLRASVDTITTPNQAAPPNSDASAGAQAAETGANLALIAKSSTSYVSPHETITALNDGSEPNDSNDKSHGAYGNWPRTGTQWVQYEWSQPISTRRMEVYWFDDGGGVRVPKACRLLSWDGHGFVPVNDAAGLGLVKDKFNPTTFPEVTTTKLRLEIDSEGRASTGLLEWRIYDSGKSPNFAPVVEAGVDRVVVLSGKTYLEGKVKDDGKPTPTPKVIWSKASGPGQVSFENAHATVTTANFTAVGSYVLELTADDGQLTASNTLQVTVTPPPPATRLDPVPTQTYRIASPLWSPRLKQLMVNWIPHCYRKLSDPAVKEGGIDNFVQAGNKLAGRPYTAHKGYVFANAWVYNTVESMCVALEIDPQGDPEIIAAQKAMRAQLDDWLPKILGAQEPDGYLQTAYTLGGHRRWSNKSDHEGYTAGYFIESAIAHYRMTHRADPSMYRAARQLADCWDDHIGPAPKQDWYDGHQELEQALARLARFVDEVEGPGKGRKYLELAKFLLDARKHGEAYDQSHQPVNRQYEAVGHAVRAVYSYSGMADIARATGDVDYHSAVLSIWDNIVNKKYYVTGGVGSGETSEGFGPDYSLPNNAYCESCSGCGELFFQHKLNLAYQDAKYADLFEETLYNAILGDVDLEARNFTYTNPLDSRSARYAWHVCPCCVGNIPRTLLMLPTWMYARNADSIFVNLFIGSTVTLENIAGADVQMIQATDYPWNGKVSITVNPSTAKRFTVKIRVPNRHVSALYTSTPEADGIISLTVNGNPMVPAVERGYASVTRAWTAGDRIELVLPMAVQRVKASDRIAADAGRVALRYGPLIYNLESVDQDVEQILSPNGPLTAEWDADLLGGVMVIRGSFANGTPLTAIPNYARNNRSGRSLVWIKDR